MVMLLYSGPYSDTSYTSWLVSPLWTLDKSQFLEIEYITRYNMAIEIIDREGNEKALLDIHQHSMHWGIVEAKVKAETFHMRIRVVFKPWGNVPRVIAAVRKVWVSTKAKGKGMFKGHLKIFPKHNASSGVFKVKNISR